jgi:hypothetical protein
MWICICLIIYSWLSLNFFFSFGKMHLHNALGAFLTAPLFQMWESSGSSGHVRPRCVWQGRVLISAPDLQLSDAGQWQQEEAQGVGG